MSYVNVCTLQNCYTIDIFSAGCYSSETESLPTYYNFFGYSKFSSANEQLARANESISITFKFCQSDGVLMYARDGENMLYFALGVYRSRVLIEFNLGEGLREVCYTP